MIKWLIKKLEDYATFKAIQQMYVLGYPDMARALAERHHNQKRES